MSFAPIERSVDAGRPIALYEFVLGPTTWRYTSADEDIVLSGNTYKSIAISDNGFRQTGEAAADAFTISGPVTMGPVQVHTQSRPSSAILVRQRLLHEGDTEAPIRYSGELSQVTLRTPGMAELVCETISASMQREGLRIVWMRACPFAVYDETTCKLLKSAHAQALTLQSIAGLTVTVSTVGSQPDGWFSGGFIEWTDPVRGLQCRQVESHVGLTFLMFDGVSDLLPGLAVTAYPGCTRTPTGCTALGNYPNYGGFERMPGKSPFDGSPVF